MTPMVSALLLRSQTDDRLLELARAGHERAFEALVLRYRKPLVGYCRRLLLSESRAEDVVQQAFLSAWTSLAAGAEVAHVRAWLYRITHNAALNARKRSGYDYVELHDALHGADAPEEDLERRSNIRETLAAMAALPELQREALIRTAVDGDSYDRVAQDLGLSGTVVRGLVYRARVSVRTAATAITPIPLLAWTASRGAHTVLAARVAEIVGGKAGSAGVGAILIKGGAVVAAAGAVATGTGALPLSLPLLGHSSTPVHIEHARPAQASSRISPAPPTGQLTGLPRGGAATGVNAASLLSTATHGVLAATVLPSALTPAGGPGSGAAGADGGRPADSSSTGSGSGRGGRNDGSGATAGSGDGSGRGGQAGDGSTRAPDAGRTGRGGGSGSESGSPTGSTAPGPGPAADSTGSSGSPTSGGAGGAAPGGDTSPGGAPGSGGGDSTLITPAAGGPQPISGGGPGTPVTATEPASGSSRGGPPNKP